MTVGVTYQGKRRSEYLGTIGQVENTLAKGCNFALGYKIRNKWSPQSTSSNHKWNNLSEISVGIYADKTRLCTTKLTRDLHFVQYIARSTLG